MSKPQAASLYESEKKIYPREISGRFDKLSRLATISLLGLFYGGTVAGVGRPPGISFRSSGEKIPSAGPDPVAAGFSLPGPAVDHRCTGTVFLYCIGRAVVVWVCMSANRVDRSLHLDGTTHRGHALAAHEARQGTLVVEQNTAKIFQAVPVDHLLTVDRLHLRRLLSRQFASWVWTSSCSMSAAGRCSGACSMALRLTATPATCASRSASTWCPYARFQGAMFDKDTLIISYDTERGEPRGGRKRSVDHKAAGLGDCIDCTLCVQVCPTGIDIRKGLQYECIACAACIDACDSVMDRMNYPRGLIRYTTEHALEHKNTDILRPENDRVRGASVPPDWRSGHVDGDSHTDYSRCHSRSKRAVPRAAERYDRKHLHDQTHQSAQRHTTVSPGRFRDTRHPPWTASTIS